jgi:hypothetical protein
MRAKNGEMIKVNTSIRRRLNKEGGNQEIVACPKGLNIRQKIKR